MATTCGVHFVDLQPVASVEKGHLETVLECDNADESNVSTHSAQSDYAVTPMDLVLDTVLEENKKSTQAGQPPRDLIS
jgi:hypothetical protein